MIGPDTMLASNTSSISITRLAAAPTGRSVSSGFNFMNPVPLMELVELVRAASPPMTTRSKLEAVRHPDAHKTYAVAEDFPAFIVNRILLPMINEAIYTLYEGVGSVDAIDRAMKLCANHPMGPLQLADSSGSIPASPSCRCCRRLADSKYRPCPLLVKYVEAGWLGRKDAARLLLLSRREARPHPLIRGCPSDQRSACAAG